MHLILMLVKRKDRCKNIGSSLIGFKLIADNNRKFLTKFMLSSNNSNEVVTPAPIDF